MKKSILNYSGFIVGPIMSAGINFLTIPIITRFVGPSEFGKTAIFSILQTLGIAIVYLGLDHAFVREFNDEDDKEKLFTNCVLAPSFFTFLLCIICSTYFFLFEKSLYSVSLFYFSLFLLLSPLERFILLSYRMEEDSKRFAFFSVLIKVIVMLTTIFLLIILEKNYYTIILGTALGQVISDVIIILFSVKHIKFNFSKIDKTFFEKLLKYGIPFVPAAIILWMLSSTDRILLKRFGTLDELGVYLVAMKVVAILAIFQNIFITIWVPTAFKWKKNNKSNEIFPIISEILTFCMSLVFISILLFKVPIVWILSNEYKDVIYIVPFLLFYPIMYTLSETTGIGIAFSRKTKYNLYVSLSVMIINIISCTLIIPKYGAIGASIAIAISYISYFFIKTLVSRNVWFKFKLTYYLYVVFYLIIVATINIVIEQRYSVLVNLLFLLVFVGSQLKKFKYWKNKILLHL
ncbi:lipopolysaccharide biosynthesis protein [Carnobacterium maltaromaticum]|uniref:lipopolysaccharide biosynthesis protein n=1 Tax=Carnobacterium maltaromaticum TaxID=2751 RepID=UPI00295E3B80|nr:oligosaccharide flippase family protein [Carnobacterium maltaromaticum]